MSTRLERICEDVSEKTTSVPVDKVIFDAALQVRGEISFSSAQKDVFAFVHRWEGLLPHGGLMLFSWAWFNFFFN